MDLNNSTFLVCDDSILARKQIMDAIKSFSNEATFFEAKNGDEAVALYKEHKPDMTFMDIVMPVKDGTTALTEIMTYDQDAVIIVASSVGTQEQLKKAIELGAKDFLQKPIDKNQIKAIVNSRLGGK